MKRLLSAILLSCCTFLAHAEGFESGVDAYRVGDYAKALRIFQDLSARGYGDSDWMLSIMYANGTGVAQDTNKSEEFAVRAAERGVEEAFVVVAILHFSKKSGRFDPAKGMELLQKGANKNNAESMRHLALQKMSGDYIAQDKEAAFKLIKKCMELGSGLCSMELADMYAKGIGTPQNHTKAFRLYQSIRDDGGDANYHLGLMSEAGQGTKQDYVSAMEYYMSAAKKQNGASMNRIGELYLRGLGVPRDYAQAALWFEKAADFHDSEGLLNGGKLYAQGLGVKRDDAEAQKWYEEAVEQGNSDAMRVLARFFEEGRGVGPSTARARQLYCNAAFLDQKRMTEELAAANPNADARKRIVGELAVLYQCKENEDIRKSASILESQLTETERNAAHTLAQALTPGGIGKAVDAYTGKN